MNAMARRLKEAEKCNEIDLQPASLDIWERKYQLKSSQEKPVDQTPEETFSRVARALADIETTLRNRMNGTKNFSGR